MTKLSRLHLQDRAIIPSIVAVVCMLGVSVLQLPQLNEFSSSPRIASQATLNKELRSEKLRLSLMQRIPTFGFDNLIADWTFLNFIQYFGDEQARQKTGYSLSPDYFESIIAHDPRFLAAYAFISPSTSIYAAAPELSVQLMTKGLKLISPTVPQKSYYIWRYKGIDELLFLGDAPAAKHSFEMAAKWASSYSDEESQQVAAISRGTAEFLARNPKSKSAQIAAWTMVLNNQVDNQTQKLAIARIRALGGDVVVSPEGVMQVKIPKED